MQAAIDARNVSFHIDGKPILQSVDFTGYEGELIGLLGPNGAGKSTLLRLLIGLHRPLGGTVTLHGRDIRKMSVADVARRVAYVPQDTSVAFDFSVRDVVMMGRHPHLGRFAVEGPEDYAIAAEAMDHVGVLQFADRVIGSLSGGERQMVFIAKALAQKPRVLLLDEPISALDIGHQLHVLSLLQSLAESGMTVVTALHDLNLAARFCHRLYMMAGGRIVVEGRPEQVYTTDVLARCYGVHALVRFDDAIDSFTVTAVGNLGRVGAPSAHEFLGANRKKETMQHEKERQP